MAGRGTILGDPTFRAGQVHDLSVYAPGPRRIDRYSGRFLITSVRHSLAAGRVYQTTFGARLKGPR